MKHLKILFVFFFMMAMVYAFPATGSATDWTPMKSGIDDGHTLTGIWGRSGSDVFAVGWWDTEDSGNGIILHYDGNSWSTMYSGTKNFLMMEVWGSSGSDVFAVGWDTDHGNLILHYNGSAWSRMDSGTTSSFFNSVWGSSGNDVFAVGDIILHYDGSTWSAMDAGTISRLYSVWGSSSSDVFAVGDNGILHYDGSTWSPMISRPAYNLMGVWGSSGSDVFAVGDNGTILHYNGSAWTPMNSGSTSSLYSVWGSSSNDVFAVGDNGTILHYNGSAWSVMNSGVTLLLGNYVWGSSGSDVFVVGYNYESKHATILHYSGHNETIPINFDETVSGEWDSGVESTNRPSRYAKYYTFTLTTATDVQIDLESSVDTYMFLLEGDGTDGNVIIEDDDGGNKYNSRITRRLEAGTYTIEATTYSAGRTGDFNLMISEIPSDDCALTDISMGETVDGLLSNTCVSTNRPDRYAHYYTFTLEASANVQIDLESHIDPYLYLMRGSVTDGDVIARNDDGGYLRDARISKWLEAGTYTIEATTYTAGRVGEFSLTIQ